MMGRRVGWVGDDDAVGAGGDGPVSERSASSARLRSVMFSWATRHAGIVGGKAGHPSNEPTLLGRRMAGVLECELFPPAGENRADPLRERAASADCSPTADSQT